MRETTSLRSMSNIQATKFSEKIGKEFICAVSFLFL